jgi:hypothetical protein
VLGFSTDKSRGGNRRSRCDARPAGEEIGTSEEHWPNFSMSQAALRNGSAHRRCFYRGSTARVVAAPDRRGLLEAPEARTPLAGNVGGVVRAQRAPQGRIQRLAANEHRPRPVRYLRFEGPKASMSASTAIRRGNSSSSM